jgi:hypothetical protein
VVLRVYFLPCETSGWDSWDDERDCANFGQRSRRNRKLCCNDSDMKSITMVACGASRELCALTLQFYLVRRSVFLVAGVEGRRRRDIDLGVDDDLVGDEQGLRCWCGPKTRVARRWGSAEVDPRLPVGQNMP